MSQVSCTEYRWSPDAKFLKRSDGRGIGVNFATGSKIVFDPDSTARISSFSGITFPFQIDQDLDPSDRSRLIENGFLIAEDEFEDLNRRILEAVRAVSEESSGLIIMPTEKCNFRCTYCYESFEKGRMRPERVEALSAAIRDRVKTARSFSLGFFGGEPLLCSDIVLRLAREGLEACAKRGIQFAASMSTNASLLTPDLFDQLVGAGLVFFQVTLDGDRELHDRQRVTVKGKGTFDQIVSNLRAMAATDHQFTVGLRCNVHADDNGRILDLFEMGDLEFMRNDPRFIVDVHQIWSSDRNTMDVGKKAEGCVSKDEGCVTGLKAGMDRYMLNAELTRRGLATVDYDAVPGLLGRACYAGKKNWFVVGADLALYKCTVVFDNPKNKVGTIAADGSFVVDEGLNRLWTGSNTQTDSGCGSCYLRVPCGGLACPLARFTSGIKGCLELRDSGNLKTWAERLHVPTAGPERPAA